MGESERIAIKLGTLVQQVYGQAEVVETYSCNYSLNPEYQEQIGQGKLRIVGHNREGAVRIVELEGHRYFVGCLFLPQMSSSAEQPHPIIKGYLKEALRFSRVRQSVASA